MEIYVKQVAERGEEYFITTEHFDLESHIMDGRDISADLDRQEMLVKQLTEKTPLWRMYCNMDPSAAEVSHKAMSE
jgi:histidinol phosphatase-like PHP family hydrolase